MLWRAVGGLGPSPRPLCHSRESGNPWAEWRFAQQSFVKPTCPAMDPRVRGDDNIG